MRALQIISGNDNGGGGNHVFNICKYSKGNFHAIMGCIGEGSLYDKCVKNEIKATIFCVKDFFDGRFIKYCEEQHIDVIDFHGPKAFFLHKFVSRKLAASTVATVHSDYRYDFMNSKLKRVFFTPLSYWGLKSFKNYICVSKYIKDVLEENGLTGKMMIVNNGYDFNKRSTLENYHYVRQRYDISEEDFVFVCVARLHPVKNHTTLIEAFNELQMEHENVKLLLVGDGALEESLKRMVKDMNLDAKVIFAGFQNNPANYINASNISILTSISEGGAPPLVILESSAVKKSVICSNVGDVGSFLTDGMGYLIVSNTKSEILDNMKRAIRDREYLNEKGEELHKYARREFSMENFCKKYFNAYETLHDSR